MTVVLWAGLKEAQMRSLLTLTNLLNVAGADYRLDRNEPTEPIFELRLNGKHWGFVSIAVDGTMLLI